MVREREEAKSNGCRSSAGKDLSAPDHHERHSPLLPSPTSPCSSDSHARRSMEKRRIRSVLPREKGNDSMLPPGKLFGFP
ncbi:hypothetical protein RHMOL_Rhmol10G0289400 [Rhododendron molle]|uniref:Uncharacterized protein n=1 Tax=Rhododendron molle TaxID=49168 RepID=A0ACC0M7J6_RHOML|nr:hypothetical protein RHMOL_Rhmol10G0289400 [Rhododendron molle]